MEKVELRSRMLKRRRSEASEEIERKSYRIWERLRTFDLFLKGRGVLFYLALKDEVQTHPMIKAALGMGKRISVPLIDEEKREILPSILKDPDKELTSGHWGILEPKRKFYHPQPLEEIDLVIVPGVAFDEAGNRLGFGRGFYDKFLRRLPERVIFVALAFELQVVKSVPSRSHDVAVDYIITEKRIIKCKERRRGRCTLKDP